MATMDTNEYMILMLRRKLRPLVDGAHRQMALRALTTAARADRNGWDVLARAEISRAAALFPYAKALHESVKVPQ